MPSSMRGRWGKKGRRNLDPRWNRLASCMARCGGGRKRKKDNLRTTPGGNADADASKTGQESKGGSARKTEILQPGSGKLSQGSVGERGPRTHPAQEAQRRGRRSKNWKKGRKLTTFGEGNFSGWGRWTPIKRGRAKRETAR